jgi:hypothetical protein
MEKFGLLGEVMTTATAIATMTLPISDNICGTHFMARVHVLLEIACCLISSRCTSLR